MQPAGGEYLVGTWVQHEPDMEASSGGPCGRRHSMTRGADGGTLGGVELSPLQEKPSRCSS